MRISCVWFGLVQFWPEQISAVTASVPEQWQPEHTITIVTTKYIILHLVTIVQLHAATDHKSTMHKMSD